MSYAVISHAEQIAAGGKVSSRFPLSFSLSVVPAPVHVREKKIRAFAAATA
jgi:hypothetical protein